MGMVQKIGYFLKPLLILVLAVAAKFMIQYGFYVVNILIMVSQRNVQNDGIIDGNTLCIAWIVWVVCVIVVFYFCRGRSKQENVNVSEDDLRQTGHRTSGRKVTLVESGMFAVIGLIFGIVVLSVINSDLFPELTGGMADTEAVNGVTLLGRNDTSIVLYLISVVVLTPIAEELLFRKYLSDSLSKISYIPRIILASALFGVCHLQLVQGVYTFILGIILMILYEKKNKIIYCILLHIGFNVAYPVLLMFCS